MTLWCWLVISLETNTASISRIKNSKLSEFNTLLGSIWSPTKYRFNLRNFLKAFSNFARKLLSIFRRLKGFCLSALSYSCFQKMWGSQPRNPSLTHSQLARLFSNQWRWYKMIRPCSRQSTSYSSPKPCPNHNKPKNSNASAQSSLAPNSRERVLNRQSRILAKLNLLPRSGSNRRLRVLIPGLRSFRSFHTIGLKLLPHNLLSKSPKLSTQ